MPEGGQRAGGWQPTALPSSASPRPWQMPSAESSCQSEYCGWVFRADAECVAVSELAEQSSRSGTRALAQQGFTHVALPGVCDCLGFQCWESVAGRQVQAVLKITNCSSR